jgi:hypothetical protein
MASKNQYKKHAMVFAKNKKQRIIVERKGDFYYISEGFSMLRIPYVFYEILVHPLAPLFVKLEDGQKAIREAGREFPTIGCSDGSLARIFDNTKATLETTVTCFLYDDPDCNRSLHLVNVGKRLVAYNDEFLRATMEYATAFNATNDRHPVLKFEDEIGVGCIIMPVNSESFAADLETLRKFL